MRGFERTAHGYVALLDSDERRVVAGVLHDVLELLGGLAPSAGPATDPGETAGQPWPDGPRWTVPEVVPPTPEDPALLRLLPDASRDDPEVAGEFRRLTQGDLLAAKRDRLEALHRAVLAAPPGRPHDELVVPLASAAEVAAALTDVRLVLAQRLDLRTEQDADDLYDELARRPTRGQEGRRFLGAVYEVMTWLQESLVQQLAGTLPPGDGAERPR